MKMAVLLSILLITPNNSYTNKQSPTGAINTTKIELMKQEQADKTKIALAIIAGFVTLVIAYYRGSAGISDAITFDQMIIDLSKK